MCMWQHRPSRAGAGLFHQAQDRAQVRHLCPYCIARDHDLYTADGRPDWYKGLAQTKVKNGIPDRKRTLRWKKATEENRIQFPALSRSGIRELVVQDVQTIVSPLVKWACLKLAILNKRFNEYIPERGDLIQRLRNADSEQEQYELYNAINDLDIQIEKTKRPIAFSGLSDSDRCF
eukprot:11854381-Alexandrium_andersonii.AAC.1